jgi:dolichol-phosphate mannosyltransferase
MSLIKNLCEMERVREAYWSRYPTTSTVKLRWRAVTVRHCFHILPGESVLELGAGSGIWTEELDHVLRGENPITALVFNQDLLDKARKRKLRSANFIHTDDLNTLEAESFDYVVGTAILCHDRYPQNLRALLRLLKPGGQLLFFEANFWNPQVLIKSVFPRIGRWAGNAKCQVGIRKYKLLQMASHEGFVNLDVIPYDIVHPRTPRLLIPFIQSIGFIFEHAPLIKELCGTLYIWAAKPAAVGYERTLVNLATDPRLFASISFVIPCHNEEMNIARLIYTLMSLYDQYIHEIIIVDDNSTDSTAEIAMEISSREPRVRVIVRKPPNGVGRALRDGYAAATGRYILTMDSDFVQIVPELRDLFQVVAAGRDGALGSRFSHDSIMVNYPFFKILCNRSFHFMAKLLLRRPIHDISNNLKFYRAEILKGLEIEENHFAANVETGLKPILAGYDIQEVPISWINRTIDMGSSSFRIINVAPNYLLALVKMIWKSWRTRSLTIPAPRRNRYQKTSSKSR